MAALALARRGWLLMCRTPGVIAELGCNRHIKGHTVFQFLVLLEHYAFGDLSGVGIFRTSITALRSNEIRFG